MMGLNMDDGNAGRAGAWLYLDEVMHRALNDYTVMLSIVRRASLTVADPSSGQALDEVTLRLNAAATAFRALTPPLDTSSRRLDAELEAVCGALSDSILPGDSIRVAFAAEPIGVSAWQSWKICLVVSELVTNAARHAFRSGRGGSIMVQATLHAGMVRCAVIADGRAPAIVAPGRGTAILDAIASELGGAIMRSHTAQGSTVVLQVPVATTGGAS